MELSFLLDLLLSLHGVANPRSQLQTCTLDRFSIPRPLSLRLLRRFLRELPNSVYRAKGVLNVDRSPDRSVVLHVVGPRVELDFGAPWDDGPRRSDVVFIGDGDLDPQTLEASLIQCEKRDPRAAEGLMTGMLGYFRRLLRTN